MSNFVAGRSYVGRDGNKYRFVGDSAKKPDSGIFMMGDGKYVTRSFDDVTLVATLLANGGTTSAFDLEAFLKYCYDKVNEIAKSYGLVLKEDYTISDGGTKSYEPKPMFKTEDGVVEKVVLTYYGDGYESVGEIEFDVLENEVELDFPDWNVSVEEKYGFGGKIGRKRYAEGGKTDTSIAQTILSQLGGTGRLNAMTGAYNFTALKNGVAFRIKNQKANYIKITLTSMDEYDLEVGRIRGGDYKVVNESKGIQVGELKPLIEKFTGMYLSFGRMAKGGMVKKVVDGIEVNYMIDAAELCLLVDEATMEYLLDESSFIHKKDFQKDKNELYSYCYEGVDLDKINELNEILGTTMIEAFAKGGRFFSEYHLKALVNDKSNTTSIFEETLKSEDFQYEYEGTEDDGGMTYAVYSVFIDSREKENRIEIVTKQLGGYTKADFAKGGRISWVGGDDRYKRSWGRKGMREGQECVGSFDIEGWKGDDGYLYMISDFDKEYWKDVPLKENEMLFRYESNATKAGNYFLVIKINLEKGLIYFLEDLYSDDDKNLKFETRGVKPLYISMNEEVYKELAKRPNYKMKENFAVGGKVGFSLGDFVLLKDIPENLPREIKVGDVENKWEVTRISNSNGDMQDIFGYDIKIVDPSIKYVMFVYPNEIKSYSKMAKGGSIEPELNPDEDDVYMAASMQYGKGGNTAAGEWVVYNGLSYKKIATKKSHRAAKMAMDKLWNQGNYESLGMMNKKDWDLMHQMKTGGIATGGKPVKRARYETGGMPMHKKPAVEIVSEIDYKGYKIKESRYGSCQVGDMDYWFADLEEAKTWVDTRPNAPKFTDYKGIEIMYVPTTNEYFVGESQPFSSMKMAQKHIDRKVSK